MNTEDALYDNEEKLAADFVEVPAWIDQALTLGDVAAIYQGGCESGAYMPAVTYHQAAETMADHGDDVLEFLDSIGVEMVLPEGISWSGIAVHYLSAAVDYWVSGVADDIAEKVNDNGR